MPKQQLRCSKLMPFLMAFGSIYLGTGLLGTVFPTLGFANLYGFLALFFYILSLFPSNGSVLLTCDRLPVSLRDGLLMGITRLRKYRRHIGVMCFGFSLAHGVLILYQHSATWDPNTAHMAMMPHYWHGLTLMSMMTVLAITSNNWCVKTLRQSWHLLHRLTYPMAFLLLYHVLRTMQVHWSNLTIMSVLLLGSTLFGIGYRYFKGYLFCTPRLMAQFRSQKRSKVLTKV